MADQIVTITEKTVGSVKVIKWAWKSATGGGVSSETTATFDGKIITLVTNPGSAAPDPNYDVTILDEFSEDVLVGAGMNRHTSTTELVNQATLGAVAGHKLTLTITGANDEKEGIVYLYIR